MEAELLFFYLNANIKLLLTQAHTFKVNSCSAHTENHKNEIYRFV